MQVSRDEIWRARKTILSDYLLERYPDEYYCQHNSVKSDRNPGLSIALGFAGYNHFISGDHGNAIDFLVKYKGFTFVDAVVELNSFQNNRRNSSMADGFLLPPKRKDNTMPHAYDYLVERCILPAQIEILTENNLVYEDNRNNLVFVNKNKNYCEITGTGDTPYFRCCSAGKGNYWRFPSCENARTVAVCKNALDAICLKYTVDSPLLPQNATVISIAGPGKDTVIDAFLAQKKEVILALRNDIESDAVCEKYPHLLQLRPQGTAWIDDYILMIDEFE